MRCCIIFLTFRGSAEKNGPELFIDWIKKRAVALSWRKPMKRTADCQHNLRSGAERRFISRSLRESCGKARGLLKKRLDVIGCIDNECRSRRKAGAQEKADTLWSGSWAR